METKTFKLHIAFDGVNPHRAGEYIKDYESTERPKITEDELAELRKEIQESLSLEDTVVIRCWQWLD